MWHDAGWPILTVWLAGKPAKFFRFFQALRSRGDDYRDYQRSTSPSIPWFPKKQGSTP